jgi:Holliday junction resolvase RusA-like endonuclease
VPEVSFTVFGTPAPQGSKFATLRGGKLVVVDDNKKALGDWRKAVEWSAAIAMRGKWDTQYYEGPVGIEVQFLIARPRGHYRTGRYEHLLRDDAPVHPQVRPDVDKLARAVLDALTIAQAIRDDSRVTDLHAVKSYARRGQQPGALITIREIWEQEP